jgi:hypothetical protein
MTDSRSQPDIERVLHSADLAVTSPRVALDPHRIREIARGRVHRRRRVTCVVAASCLVIAGYVATTRIDLKENNIATSEATAAKLLAELDRLDHQFDSVMATAEQAFASSDISTQANEKSLVERLQQQTRLAELQQEVARLEAEAPLALTDDFQLAWLRAGTKRLALAHLNAELSPDVAAECYRTLAANYAGSPISDAALHALEQLPHP